MLMLRSVIKNMHKNQHGAAVIEFALVIIPLLMIVGGIVEFGRAFWYYDALVKSTRDAARYVSGTRVNPAPGQAVDDSVKSNAKVMVLNSVNAANVPAFSLDYVDVSCEPVDCVTPNYVTVRIVNYPVTIGGWIPIIIPSGTAKWSTTISPATTMRYMK